ncbi:MAG: cytochrome C [Sulfurimonas sp.]|nr:cytochrome C [Sulfurimonas sp.]
MVLNINANEMGSLLFHGNCTTCHFENKTVSAPSVVDFKERYMTAFAEKKEFVKYMSEWVEHPKKETSIMLDAIEKHELMPELGFDIETLKTISEYIYETDFTQKHSGHKD